MATLAGRGSLQRAQEARVHKRADKEFRDDEVRRYYADQRSKDAATAAALKDDLRRFQREEGVRQAEEQMLQSFDRALKEKQLREVERKEEDWMASALLAQHSAEQRQRCQIANLHAHHDVLQDLALKLKTAAVNRERHLQLQEKQLIAGQEREYNCLLEERLEAERLAAVQAEEQRQQDRRNQNIKAKHTLEDQMQERVQQQVEAVEEHARDRAAVDAVMAAIEEEDRLHEELKRQKAAETMQYIHEFVADRDARREAVRAQELEEDRKIQAHLQELKRREDEQRAAQEARTVEADRIFARLKAEKEAEMAAQAEQEFLMDMLYRERTEAKARMKEADQLQRQARMRSEMLAANEKQMEAKARRRAEEAAEEERVRTEMLEKFAEDDRVEQMNARARRLKMQEHRREADRLIALKREMYERARAQEAEWQAQQRAAEEAELDMVERERRKMLREAAELLEYLPKGVMRTREDLDYVLELAKELKEKGTLQP